MDIILASNSPRRKDLLKNICSFRVITSGVDENIGDLPPEEFCKTLAYIKAQSVAKDYFNSLVIGADTIVVCNDKIIGKPKDEQDNIKILKAMCVAMEFMENCNIKKCDLEKRIQKCNEDFAWEILKNSDNYKK